jgi:hypothetical protein
MANNGSVGPGCPGESTTVADLLLDAADDCSFRELAHGENISNAESSLLAAVDEGTGVKTLSGDEGFFAEFVAVWIAEDDTGKRSTSAGSTHFSDPFLPNTQQDVPARVVDDLLNNTANIAVPFGKVEGP